MNYGGNMPDWHQYNSTQPIGSEVPPVGQNASHSPIFGPNISPRRLNGPTFSPEGLNKPQNDTNFNPRNFQQSPNTSTGPNVPSGNSPMGSAAQIPGFHGPYGAPSPRNTMIEGTSASYDSRNVAGGALTESMDQRNHQISMSRQANHLNCSTINGSMGSMGQRSTPTNIQGPIPPTSRQAPGSYIPPCKLPCCNADTNISYQGWEKFGPYPPNVPYRETTYPVDNRRFGNEFENREQLSTSAFNMDPRRNFTDYKYRKDPIIPRTYAHTPGVIQNYPIQNYNFPSDYQKYPAYPMKEYPRESSIPNPQNPAVLKYQEQSVIVQQKYFTKQIQYQNGVIPKNIVPTSIGNNVISRAQNPYFNPQLARDFPRSYSDSNALANRGIQTPNPIHAAYPKYQMYQQKIAIQRFSMENHLRELTRIPGYQSHPKYQESVLRYRELLRLQGSVDYQSSMQDSPKVVTSQINEDIPPINLQFDQHGVLINSSFATPGFSNVQSPIDQQSLKNVQSSSNTDVRPLNLQHSEQFKTQANINDCVQDQNSSTLSQTELSHKREQQYSIQREQSRAQKYESENLNVPNTDEGKTSSMHQKNSRDFADKPELDVRQFLANWDESEDEDGTNANLPDVVLSNSASCVSTGYESTKILSDNPDEFENCSETEDCRSRDDCGTYENTLNDIKPSNSMENQNYRCVLPPSDEIPKTVERHLDIFDPGKGAVRTGTVIQPTSNECANEISLDIMEDSSENQATNGDVKSLSRDTESLNNNENQEITDKVEDNPIIKKEPLSEDKEHIETYNNEADTKISSSIDRNIENNEDSRSSSDRGSSEDRKDQFESSDDISESDDTDSMDSHSISSFMNSPKTIKGTEIHVDAQELSAIPASPKNNSELLENTNLQKQSSFASEESHNPDDISLPDLPTSECTPISTTLNTPIHSDSEESSEPVIDLTTPANPIEIIQNSPMLSFTHSPIKMEPYEHLDENDLAEKISHDALDFEFQGSNSCDNDYEKLTDVSSHTTEQYNIVQNQENTFDSDCVEILSDKKESKIELHTQNAETTSGVMDNMSDQYRFAFNKRTVMGSDNPNTAVIADHQPWPSVTVREHEHQISNNTEHQNAKSDIDKLTTLSEMKDRLSIIPEVGKHHSKDDMIHTSSAKNYHSTNRWQTKCEVENNELESTDNMTALNLVKDENKIKSGSIKLTDDTVNSEAFPKASRSSSYNSNNRGESFKHLSQNECNSSIENEIIFTSAEDTVTYPQSSEGDKIYTEAVENQSNYTGSLNIPLIPGEDFEEPKMPVLPMEGNCLTKIIKNTSPITDLDVLGSDDEKLDKMDEIWMDVRGVDTVSKVSDVNIDTYIECGENSDPEKNSFSKKRPGTSQKKGWKSLKNSLKLQDPSKLFEKVHNDSCEKNSKNAVTRISQPRESPLLETAQEESKSVSEDLQVTIVSGPDNVAAILQGKHNFTKAPTISRVMKNSSSCSDGKQNNDICLENNTPEILRCQEKANHINDIATKLLKNARLFEPEQRKSICGNDAGDSSKNRMKHLKEFRKVKNKIITEKSEVQSTKSVSTTENDIVPSNETTDQYKKIDTGAIDRCDKIMKHENALADTIEGTPQRFDAVITNSVNTVDCYEIQRSNVNTEENSLPEISKGITMNEENQIQISNGIEVILHREDTLKETSSNVNEQSNITVGNSNSNDDHNTFETKVVNPKEEDINECAINLSKLSNDLCSLQTISEKGCATNDSHKYSLLENSKIDEPREIESKACEETISTKRRDEISTLTNSSYMEEDTLCTKKIEEDNKNSIEFQNVMQGDQERSPASTCANSVQECILEENTKLETDQDSADTADHVESTNSSTKSDPERVEDSATSDHTKELIDSTHENSKNSNDVCEPNHFESSILVPEQRENLKLSGYGAGVEKEDQEPTVQTIDSEATHNAESVREDSAGTPTINTEESIELINNLYDSEEKRPQSDSPEEEILIGNSENSLQTINDTSEDVVIKPTEKYIEMTLVPYQENDISKSSVKVKKFMEPEPKVYSDCSEGVQDNLQNSDRAHIDTELSTIYKDLEDIQKPSNVNESPIKMQLEEYTNSECSKNTNPKQTSETEKTSNTVDETFGAFGLENSFTDFNNFDVAPNSINIADTDQSNDWKYSKAYARFEDCERYKNPDNFVDPILPSLETLDNLNTVPVYTTKDGKITYSPNPRFTYRALIMEAREREGYPTQRESYPGVSRAQGSLNHSKNQVPFRKRKSSDSYSHSGRYGKKNDSEYYEPREHGESSTNNSSEPCKRIYFNQNKYRHQSRNQKSHHFIPHNNEAEKKHSTDRIVDRNVSSKFKHREESAVLDEHNERKNGTSDSFKYNIKKHYKQSTERSAFNSMSSQSKRHLKYDQNSSDVDRPRPETNKIVDNKENKERKKAIRNEKHGSSPKDYDQSKNFRTEKSDSTSDENKHTNELSTNISPAKEELSIFSDISSVEKKCPELRDEEMKSSSPWAEDEPLNSQNPEKILDHGRNAGSSTKPGAWSSEWEESRENLPVQQLSPCEMEMSTEPLVDGITEDCNDKSNVDNLYDEADDLCRSNISDINEKTSGDTDFPDNRAAMPLESVNSPTRNEIFEESIAGQETSNSDELIDNDAKNEDASLRINPTEKQVDDQKISEIPETPDEHEQSLSLHEGAAFIEGENTFNQSLSHKDDQMSSNCTNDVRDIDNEELVKDVVQPDKETEFTTPTQISDLQDSFVPQELNNKISHSSENPCSIQETKELEKKEPKSKSYKIKSENKNEMKASNSSLFSKILSDNENTSKPQSQFENYIAYSPSNECSEDIKAIPKLVIKKTDSLNCKSMCIGTSSATSHDVSSEKVSDKEEHSSKVSVHPKIPKILIRNAKSRPSTPSIEEITEDKIFSVTTKEDSIVPKVKVRFDEKRPKSPAVSSNENILKSDSTENKIPKMKIKLEDRLPKVIIENTDKEFSGSNEEVQKTVPKMKIRKFKGALGQIVDTQILPVSIPRMFIYTELESDKETALQILTKKEVSPSNKNSKSVANDSIPEDQKTTGENDLKKIPKLKIKRQSSGCSVDSNRKRHSMNAIHLELKKVRKSSKLIESVDNKKQRSSVASEHREILRKSDTFSVEQSYESASSENIEYTSVTQSTESVRGEPTPSTRGNFTITPEEIPKVIIKRISPTAEFKCELSKVRRDAIIKNKRWQPEVKLQRSWVLDCMAKDLNLDKLRLKLATPASMLKKRLPPKEPELGEVQMKSCNVDTNHSERKLFRSKSTSELLSGDRSFEQLAPDNIEELEETDITTDSPKKFFIPKRCKSDLGSTFSKYSKYSECKKKLKRNHLSTMQTTSKPTLNYVNDFENSSNAQSVQEADMVIEQHQETKDLKTDFNFKKMQSDNEATSFMEISEKSQDKTLLKNEISQPEVNTSLLDDGTSSTSFIDYNLNSKSLSGSAHTTGNSKIDGVQEENDNHSDYSTTKCRDGIAVSKHSVIVTNVTPACGEKHTESGKKYAKDIRNRDTGKHEAVEAEDDGTLFVNNISTNYIKGVETPHTGTDTDNAKVSNELVILEALVSTETDTDICKNNNHISSVDALTMENNLEIIINQNNSQELDINDNSADNVRQTNDQKDNNIAEEGSTSTLNENVLIVPAIDDYKSSNSDAKDIQDPNVYINSDRSSDEAIDEDLNSGKKFDTSEEHQKIIDILSASPDRTDTEHGMDIQFDAQEGDVCLYHEDAIPTQFELELENIDNAVPDPLEVPMPQNDDHPAEEFTICPSHKVNERGSETLDTSKSEITLSEENDYQVCSTLTYQREAFAYPKNQDTSSSMDVDKQNSTSNAFKKPRVGLESKIQNSLTHSDSLVKEVLAAKERLRKCLTKNKDEIRFKVKSRPKTPAEKKQGSSFNLNMIAPSDEGLNKLENHSPSNFNAGDISSKQMDKNSSSSNNNNNNDIHQNRSSKTELKLKKIKSERKHSKGSKSHLMHQKYSSLPTNIQKYTNLMQTTEQRYSIPEHSSIDIQDRIEFTKGETTISLKNSKHLLKNHSHIEGRKKLPELVNSKDSKCRSKSSRHDTDAKYIGKSKNLLPNMVVQESSLDFGSSEEKSPSNAAKHKYKSSKTSSDQNVNSVTDKAKFKMYKIPRITKSIHTESDKLTGEFQESQSREARMPILEPQINLNLEGSELNCDRERSRSPPVITNQESRVDYGTTCQVSLNKEKETLSKHKPTFPEIDQVPEALPSHGKVTTVADIVNDMAYHEKATIRHRRYCTLCERWFPTVTRYRRHLSGYQHRHTELTQRRTIHALFTLFTGRPCPRLQPPSVVRIDCEPGELTPLQIAVQGVTKESNKVDGNIKKPSREDK